MALGPSAAVVDGWLMSVFQQTPFSVSAVWAKAHIGAPGDGTANEAGETTRVDVSACFGTAPADDGTGNNRVITNDAAFTWTAVSDTEVWTHVSFWDDDLVGTFLGSGLMPLSVTAGDDATAQVGDCTILHGNAA